MGGWLVAIVVGMAMAVAERWPLVAMLIAADGYRRLGGTAYYGSRCYGGSYGYYDGSCARFYYPYAGRAYRGAYYGGARVYRGGRYYRGARVPLVTGAVPTEALGLPTDRGGGYRG